jgi:hypothetical protein
MRTFTNFKALNEASAIDLTPKKPVDDEKGKGNKRASKGEEDFENNHTVKKTVHPVASDSQFDGGTKHEGEHKGFEKPGEPILKTYNQFKKMGGFGKSSYRSADKTDGDKTMVKVKEDVEQVIDETFKAGTLNLKSGESIKISEAIASMLNTAINQLSGSNKARMESEAMKNKYSFNSVVKFAKSVL